MQTDTVTLCVFSVQAPVVISRDHHDVSGTDSPFRETSNVYDGSAFCAGTLEYTHHLDRHYFVMIIIILVSVLI